MTSEPFDKFILRVEKSTLKQAAPCDIWSREDSVFGTGSIFKVIAKIAHLKPILGKCGTEIIKVLRVLLGRDE